MPNMLAHMGVQGMITGALIPAAKPEWIFLGCLVPDVPWILQRLGRVLIPGLDQYDLRLYAIVQASFAACLLLSGALALLSSKPCKIFGVLALNAFLHLILDAVQTKWANGVHLFAPFTWKLLNLGLFWPESWLTLLLTVCGLAYVVWIWRYAVRHLPAPGPPGPRRAALALLLLGAYILLPLALLAGPYGADNHSLKTLREVPLRHGRAVEFDRTAYLAHATGDRLLTFTGEELHVTGKHLDHSGVVSVRATFVDSGSIRIKRLHAHWGRVRDMASYFGLLLLAAFWVRPYVQRFRV